MSNVEHLAEGVTLHLGDCLEVLDSLPENSIDAVVTDPPYELGFMGKSWDASGIAFRSETWAKVMRVLKPGAHLVAFGAPKNYHRLACAIEDAGFEIRDSLMWVFGSGFPKSLDVSKAIDKAAGAEREKIAIGNPVKRMIPGADQDSTGSWVKDNGREYQPGIEIPATDAARKWQGFGTALKPAYEPIVLARKPLSEGTVAANVLRWGTGALNIDATRIATNGEKISPRGSMDAATDINDGWSRPWMADEQKSQDRLNRAIEKAEALGRWPANLCHSGEQGVLDLFPSQKSPSTYKRNVPMGIGGGHIYGKAALRDVQNGYGDEGSAARFFYCSKASKQDRITREVEELEISWISEQGPSQVRLQVDTGRSLEKAIVASGSGAVSEWSTFLCGSTITDLCLTASKCTIKTKTSSTTELKTLSYLTRSLISACTQGVNCEMENGLSHAENAERYGLSLTIMLAKTVSLPGASRALLKTPLTINVSARRHSHPTCKPVNLMRWLVRMVTPPGGTVLDPFAGSGTTGVAAVNEGFNIIMIEKEEEYQKDIRQRFNSNPLDMN